MRPLGFLAALLGLCLGFLRDKVDYCLLRDESFWQVHKNYIADSRFVTINVLYTTNVHADETRYVGELMVRLFAEKPLVSVSTLTTLVGGKRYDEESNTFIKKRKNLGQSKETYVLVARNERDLDSYVHKIMVDFVANAQTSYLLVFTERMNSTAELEKLLMHLWVRHRTFNYVGLLMCPLDTGYIYTYNPFDLHGGVWGRLERKSYYTGEIGGKYNGYPLRVSIFERIPTAVKALPETMGHIRCGLATEYRGLDGCFLANVAHYLDFRVVPVEPADETNYGVNFGNGTVTGSLGDVARGTVDVNFNGRFYNARDAEIVDFTAPIDNDLICFIAPRAEVVPRWMGPLNCFSLKLRLALVSLVLICGTFWTVTRRITFTTERIEGSLVLDFLEITGVIFNVPPRSRPNSDHCKVFMAFFMTFNTIIAGVIQASLFTSFTTTTYYPDIDSLEDLSGSRYSIATSVDIFQEDNSAIMQELHRKLIYQDKALNRTAIRRDVVSVERRKDAAFYIKTRYLRSDGEPSLHIVRQCVASSFIAYIVPKNSPFLARLDETIRRFGQAGLPQKWYGDVVNGLVLKSRLEQIGDDETIRAYCLEDVQAVIYFYLIGVVSSSFGFLGELIRFSMQPYSFNVV